MAAGSRLLVGAYAQIAGFEYRAALDGATALREAHRRVPAAVVLDLMLPDMDGFEICSRLKSEDDTQLTLQTAEGSGTVTRLSLESTVEAFERDIIMDALKTTRGSRKRAAKLLDTTERIIGYKVKKYRIDCDRFNT